MGMETTSRGRLIQDRRRRLMRSLSFNSIGVRYSSIPHAEANTCAWLLNHPDYMGWLDPDESTQHHGFLLIYGKPGSGKSTLMKYLSKCTQKNADITISFFFNRGGNNILEQSTEGMYRSLLLQLLERVPTLQGVIDLIGHIGQRHEFDGSWEIHVLQTLLTAAVVNLGRRQVTCFVDALDECSESQVGHMLEYFKQLREIALQAKGKLYFCFSSRHYPAIRIQNGRALTLEHQLGHTEDLETYVRRNLLIDSMRDTILEKADGVFLWVVSVVYLINKEFDVGHTHGLIRLLDRPHPELNDLSRDILQRDTTNISGLLLCIQWILFAKRPLQLQEFYYAVVTGLDPNQKTSIDNVPQQITTEAMEQFVSSSSKGLAEVNRSKGGTVQFIHESVRKYVYHRSIRVLWPDLVTDFTSESHNRLRICCYAYIETYVARYVSSGQLLPNPSSYQAEVLRQEVSQQFPFLEYAAHQVLYHADTAAIDLPQHDFLKAFNLEAWLNLNNLFEKSEILRHTPSATLPYILAESNLARLIKNFLDYDSRVDIRGELYQYPLFAAWQTDIGEQSRLFCSWKTNEMVNAALRHS
ncbi:hypothetical protein F4678DRAFT_111887 [Xylaria arbuscula]|nr:hypothetical protein F4678DRAFT_111887 [Xylaria arbuscula]